MPLIARCTATLAGDELVLTMRGGAEHSRIPVDDTMDPAEAMERLHDGTMPVLPRPSAPARTPRTRQADTVGSLTGGARA